MSEIAVVIDATLEEAEARTREALKKQGFGVLTEIDLAATLKEKLGVERSAMKILGACNPGFANRALDADPDASLYLPCNVVLSAVEGGVRVAAIDPRALFTDGAVAALADEAAGLLQAAVDEVGVTAAV